VPALLACVIQGMTQLVSVIKRFAAMDPYSGQERWYYEQAFS
jgi:hypothetical protein